MCVKFADIRSYGHNAWMKVSGHIGTYSIYTLYDLGQPYTSPSLPKEIKNRPRHLLFPPQHTRRHHTTPQVFLFSKLISLFFGYFDPVNIFIDNENK